MEKLQALIQLIDDPDAAIVKQVREEIIAIGDKAIPELEQFWEDNSFEPNFRERVEDLIHTIQFNTVKDGLMDWAENRSSELIEGVYWVNKYQYPDITIEELQAQIQEIADQVIVQLKGPNSPKNLVGFINDTLYQKLGFRGNKRHFHAPQNNYLSEVLSGRKGNPLSLSIVYTLIADLMHLPIKGVNLPNHFIAAYMEEGQTESDVLFYINPFSRGTLLTHQDIVVFLHEMNLPVQEEFTKPCGNIAMVKRLLVNLIYAYTRIGHEEKVTEIKLLEEQLNTKDS